MLRIVTIVLTIGILLSVAAADEPATTIESLNHPRVLISLDSLVPPGSYFTASIILPDTTDSLGGFSLQLEYDYDAIIVDSVVSGALLAGEWEYLTHRTDLIQDEMGTDVRHAFLRIVAIADQNDREGKSPSARSKIGAGEIVKLFLYSTEQEEYLDKPIQLRFRWDDCTSNSFSDPTGNQSYLSHAVFTTDGAQLSKDKPIYAGASEKCFKSGRNKPVAYFDYYDASFLISQSADTTMQSVE